MTREEAIKIIRKMLACTDLTVRANLNADMVSACNLAIKALEQEPILEKIKEDFIARYPRNYAGGLEFGGRSCEFSLNDILKTIDKYKAESEDKE